MPAPHLNSVVLINFFFQIQKLKKKNKKRKKKEKEKENSWNIKVQSKLNRDDWSSV